MKCIVRDGLFRFAEANGLSSPDVYQKILDEYQGVPEAEVIASLQEKINDPILKNDLFRINTYVDAIVNRSNIIENGIDSTIDSITQSNETMNTSAQGVVYSERGSNVINGKTTFFKTKGIPVNIQSIIKIKNGQKTLTLRDPRKSHYGADLVQHISNGVMGVGIGTNFTARFKSPLQKEITTDSGNKRTVPVEMNLSEYLKWRASVGRPTTANAVLKEFVGKAGVNLEGAKINDSSMEDIYEEEIKDWFRYPESQDNKRIIYEIEDVTEKYTENLLSPDEVKQQIKNVENSHPGSIVHYQILGYDIPGGVPENHVLAIMESLKSRFGIDYEINNNLTDERGNPLPGMISYSEGAIGKVYINPSVATLDTLFHEYIHPFVDLMATNNPELFNSLVNEVKELSNPQSERHSIHISNIVNRVKTNYPSFVTGETLNINGWTEAIVQAIGEEAQDAFLDTREVNEVGQIVNTGSVDTRFRRLCRDFWDFVSAVIDLITTPYGYMKSLYTNVEKNIVVSELPVMTIKQIGTIIGGLDNKVNIIGVESLTIPEEEKTRIQIIVNTINQSLTTVIASYRAKERSAIMGGGVQSLQHLKNSLMSAEAIKGAVSSVYYGQSHFKDIIDTFENNYSNMDNPQRLDYLREVDMVVRTFSPLLTISPDVFNRIEFAGKTQFILALKSVQEKIGKVNSIYAHEGPSEMKKFIKKYMTKEELERFSVDKELNSGADLSLIEYGLGAMASSPDFIMGIVDRFNTNTLHEDGEELSADIQEFKNLVKEFSDNDIDPMSILADEDENGNPIPFLVSHVDRGFYDKKSELGDKLRDDEGNNKEFIAGDSTEAHAYNRDLKADQESYFSFLRENTHIDPSVNVLMNVGGAEIDIPLSQFRDTVFYYDENTGSLQIRPGFSESDVNNVMDEYFNGRIRSKVDLAGRFNGVTYPIIHREDGSQAYIYENFSVKSKHTLPNQDKWQNRKFAAIHADPKKLELYNKYQQLHEKYISNLPSSIYDKDMMPLMKKDITSGFFSAENKTAFLLNNAKNTTEDYVSNISKKQMMINGKLNPGLPLMFLSKPSKNKINRIEALKEKLSVATDPKEISKITTAIEELNNKIDYSEVDYSSFGDSFIKFMMMSNSFKSKAKIESAMMVMQSQIHNKKVYGKTLLKNEGLITTEGDEKYKSSEDSRIAKRFDEYLYGIFYGAALYDTSPGAGSIAESVVKISSITGLGLNAKAAINNSIMGNINNITEACGALFYGKSDLAKAKKEYTSNMFDLLSTGTDRCDLKILLDTLAIFEPNGLDGRFKGVTSKTYSDLLKTDSLFLLDNTVEYANQSQVILAMLESHKVDQDGSVLSYSDYKKKYEGGLKSDFESLPSLRSKITVENGKMNYGVSKSELELWKQRTKGVIQLIHGRYNIEDSAWIQRYWIGKMLLQYKRWLGATVEERFKRKYYDVRLREDMEGRYRTFGRYMFQIAQQAMGKQVEAMSWSTMSESEKGNVIKSVVDISVYAALSTLIGIAGVLMKGAKDDDDKKKYAAINFAKYYMGRARQEVTSLVNPVELYNLATNPFASSRTVKEYAEAVHALGEAAINDKEILIKSGKFKGQNKAIKEVVDVAPLWGQVRWFDKLFDYEANSYTGKR